MGVKKMEMTIDQNDPNVTLSTGTAKVMTDILVYKVPRHTVIELRPEDILSAYLKDAGSECLATDGVQLVIRDPNNLSQEVLFSGQYALIKEFQDKTKVKNLGASRLIKSDYQIALMAKATTVLVVANCYYQLTCARWAEVL